MDALREEAGMTHFSLDSPRAEVKISLQFVELSLKRTRFSTHSRQGESWRDQAWHGPAKCDKTGMAKLRSGFYSTAAWQRIRKRHLKKEPLCRICRLMGRVNGGTLEQPLHVDHIVPRDPLRLVPYKADRDDNLQSLCFLHHNQKTAAERAGKPWRIKGCDVHGQPLDPNAAWWGR